VTICEDGVRDHLRGWRPAYVRHVSCARRMLSTRYGGLEGMHALRRGRVLIRCTRVWSSDWNKITARDESRDD
jgi:hypothetical protein